MDFDAMVYSAMALTGLGFDESSPLPLGNTEVWMDERTFERVTPWWHGERKCTVITKEGYVRSCYLTARESHLVDLTERDWGMGLKCWSLPTLQWDTRAISMDITRIHAEHGNMMVCMPIAA